MRFEKIPVRRLRHDVPLWDCLGTSGRPRRAGSVRVPYDVAAGSLSAACNLWQCVGMLPVEELWAMLVDPEYRVTGFVRLARGNSNEIHLEPAELMASLRSFGTPSYLVAHNHVLGGPLPSLADWAATSFLLQLSDEAGLDCFDHVVIGEDRYASLRELQPQLFEQYEVGLP